MWKAASTCKWNPRTRSSIDGKRWWKFSVVKTLDKKVKNCTMVSWHWTKKREEMVVQLRSIDMYALDRRDFRLISNVRFAVLRIWKRCNCVVAQWWSIMVNTDDYPTELLSIESTVFSHFVPLWIVPLHCAIILLPTPLRVVPPWWSMTPLIRSFSWWFHVTNTDHKCVPLEVDRKCNKESNGNRSDTSWKHWPKEHKGFETIALVWHFLDSFSRRCTLATKLETPEQLKREESCNREYRKLTAKDISTHRWSQRWNCRNVEFDRWSKTKKMPIEAGEERRKRTTVRITIGLLWVIFAIWRLYVFTLSLVMRLEEIFLDRSKKRTNESIDFTEESREFYPSHPVWWWLSPRFSDRFLRAIARRDRNEYRMERVWSTTIIQWLNIRSHRVAKDSGKELHQWAEESLLDIRRSMGEIVWSDKYRVALILWREDDLDSKDPNVIRMERFSLGIRSKFESTSSLEDIVDDREDFAIHIVKMMDEDRCD